MSYLLFPGRHLVNTRFQETYLRRALSVPPKELTGLIPGRSNLNGPPAELVFAITSANQENSRFNPIPFHVRAMGVDRFARELRKHQSFQFRVFGIPHYGHTQNFAEFTVKEIANQSEQTIKLTPENCLVLCSTTEVMRLYQALGFSIAPVESAEPDPKPVAPIEIIREIGARGVDWLTGPIAKANLAASHQSLFEDLPEIPQRIARLYQDPLTNPEGSLTESRNYSTYARGMNEIIRLKYLDIRDGVKPGRIADEGCADGALLAEVSRDFPDSDLFGIDLSAEFAGRFHERQRAGEFGGAYVHFFHRNLFDRIFEPESIDTTICNSTLHELWSYAAQEKTVRAYLAEKFYQLRPGGRLVIRDVVGPDDGDHDVLLWCSDRDGRNASSDELAERPNRPAEWLGELSTRSRFHVFAMDFLKGRHSFHFLEQQVDGRPVFRLTRRQAAEFLSKKDYTDNWLSEMNEEFCFWSFAKWKSVISQAGFRILENPNSPAQGSRSYVNRWIAENRYREHAKLLSEKGADLDWPPNNMVIVAEKPLS